MVDADTSNAIEKRISDLIIERAQEQKELEKLEEFVETLPTTAANQLSGAGSSSRGQRTGADTAFGKEELLENLKEKKAKKSENIELLWKKICDLQEQQRALKQKQ